MDQTKIGGLIRQLRQQQGLTQAQLAERLGVSDKAVSKWERGQGCPELSLLAALSEALAVDMEALLAGDLGENPEIGGNMRKLQFYVCPKCGNILTAVGEASLSCCGSPLQPLQAKKAPNADEAGEPGVDIELIEGEYFLSSRHEMSREHYIGFVAELSGDTLIMKKCYPEWDLQVRLPRIPHAKIYWYCTKHGLYYLLPKIK